MTDLTKAIAELRRVTPPNSPWEAGDIGVGSSPVDYHISTILNAVLSGDLVPRADADLAMALMVEPLLKLREGIEADIRSAHHGRGNGSSSAMREDDRDFRAAVAAAFDALAPDAGTADLAMALMVEKAGKAIRSEAQISPYHNGMTAVYQRGLSDGFEAAAQVVDALVPASALADLKALRDERDRLDAVTNTLSEMWEGEQTARHSAEAELVTLRAQVERLTGALKSMPSRVSSVTLDDGPKSLSKDNLGAWVDGITTCEKVVQRAVDAALTEGAAP